MIKVDASTVKSDIKTFNTFSDSHVNEAIEHAKVRALDDGIPQNRTAFNFAVIDYARHLLTLDFFQNYGVVSANDLGQSETLANPNTYDDGYLKAYNDLAGDFNGTNGSISAYDGEHDNYLL